MKNVQLTYGDVSLSLSDWQIEKILSRWGRCSCPVDEDDEILRVEIDDDSIQKDSYENFIEEIIKFPDFRLRTTATAYVEENLTFIARRRLLFDFKTFCSFSAEEIIKIAAEQIYLINRFKYYINFHPESSTLINYYSKHSDPGIQEYFLQQISNDGNLRSENIQLNGIIINDHITLEAILDIVIDLFNKDHQQFIEALVNSPNSWVRILISHCKRFLTDPFVRKLAQDPSGSVRRVILDKYIKRLSKEEVIDSIAEDAFLVEWAPILDHPEKKQLIEYYRNHPNRFVREAIENNKNKRNPYV